MKGDVSGSSSRAHDGVASIDVMDGAVLRIEPVKKNAVGAQVGRQSEAVGWIAEDAVRVRRALAIDNWPATDVRHNLTARSERSIGLDRDDCDAAAVVIGDQRHPSSLIDAHVAGPGAAGPLAVEVGEPTIAGNREGAHRSPRSAVVLLDFVHGVEDATVRVNGEKRWIHARLHRADATQLSRA